MISVSIKHQLNVIFFRRGQCRSRQIVLFLKEKYCVVFNVAKLGNIT